LLDVCEHSGCVMEQLAFSQETSMPSEQNRAAFFEQYGHAGFAGEKPEKHRGQMLRAKCHMRVPSAEAAPGYWISSDTKSPSPPGPAL